MRSSAAWGSSWRWKRNAFALRGGRTVRSTFWINPVFVGLLLLAGCSSLLVRVHITGIDVDPRILPPEGGKVKVVVKTYHADEVQVKFRRTNDGKLFLLSLSQEFSWDILVGEQKWDGEIRLPANDDPEGRDHVYHVTVQAYSYEGWDHSRDAGKVVVKGKGQPAATEESSAGTENP